MRPPKQAPVLQITVFIKFLARPRSLRFAINRLSQHVHVTCNGHDSIVTFRLGAHKTLSKSKAHALFH